MITGIEKTLAAWIRTFAEDEIVLENLPKKNGAVAVCMKDGRTTVEKYMYGIELRGCAFELKTRVSSGKNSAETAAHRLELIAENCFARSKPSGGLGVTITAVYPTGSPVLTNRTNNGDDEYTLEMRVEWMEEYL